MLTREVLACVASVSVQFRSKEQGKRVKMAQAKALFSFLTWPKPRIPFLSHSLLQNQTESLAMQAREVSVFE